MNVKLYLIFVLLAFTTFVQADQDDIDTSDIESISMQIMDEDEGNPNKAFTTLTLPTNASEAGKQNSAKGLSNANNARGDLNQLGGDAQGREEESRAAAEQKREEMKSSAKDAKSRAKEAAAEARESARENAEQANDQQKDNVKDKMK